MALKGNLAIGQGFILLRAKVELPDGTRVERSTTQSSVTEPLIWMGAEGGGGLTDAGLAALGLRDGETLISWSAEYRKELPPLDDGYVHQWTP